jgi:PAS domain S-box-containing protein
MANSGGIESPVGRDERETSAAVALADAPEVLAALAKLPGPMDQIRILAIADTVPVMIAYLDHQERYQFLNRTLADWLERPRKEILGRTMREILGDKAYAVRKPRLDLAFEGEMQNFQSEFDHPSRGTLSVRSEYIPHLTPDGQVLGLILVIQDITEQRATEIALRESEERFRRIADSAPVPMWVTRIDGSRDFANQAFVDFFGFPPEKIGFHDWIEALHPEDRDQFLARQQEATEKLEPFDLIARFRRHDGEWRWVRSVSIPRLDSAGNILGLIGAASDVTEAKEAELDLKSQLARHSADLVQSEHRFRAIFNTVQEVVALLAPDGTLVDINNTHAAWRVGPARENVGLKIWESSTALAYDGLPSVLKDIVEAGAKGMTVRREVELTRDGVRAAALDLSVAPVHDSSGELEYLVIEARDVSELKAAQDQLRQSQKMEALGQLTGGIAHDFNNLLTVIVGGLDLISKRVEDERLRRYAENALSAADRGARLTTQLLAFSRVQRLEVKPTYVAPLIEEMRPLLRNVLGPGIEKHFELDPHLIPVMADPTQLEVAVLNLAINARDAMPDGGTLTFRSKRMRMLDDSELEPGEYVELSICDTGEGMAPEVATRAFEPFYTTKDVGKGTGLGLSMVYGMARQSGGTARIESEPGVGTTVKLYFRRAERDAEVPESGGQTGDQLRRARGMASILVIDDDEDVRNFIVASLEEYGHEVMDAADGGDGIARFGQAEPDLVILDFVMPGLSGAEVAAHILATRPEQPILFVSGFSETEAIRQVAPDAPILTKPFRAAALEEAVREVLATD